MTQGFGIGPKWRLIQSFGRHDGRSNPGQFWGATPIKIESSPSQPRSTPSWPGQASRPCSPSRSSPIRNGPKALSMSAIQLRGHLSSNSVAMSPLEKLVAQVTQGVSPTLLHQSAFSRSQVGHFAEPGQMENNDKTLKELATLDVLEPAQTYDLKSGLIHLLPQFHGLAGEDPTST
ncbi:hypothetical protein CR513_05711, partial [Mucuna pruriens]